jgi:curved DNA-binding protein CbpA
MEDRSRASRFKTIQEHMATQRKQDYYDVLGLPRNASPDDIKKAFRRLAMQYHPDRNKESEAEARFKEVNEAYEVLSDPERRAMYDRFGHAATQGDAGFARGFEGFGFGGLGDIFDAFFGGSAGRTQRGPVRGADVRRAITIEGDRGHDRRAVHRVRGAPRGARHAAGAMPAVQRLRRGAPRAAEYLRPVRERRDVRPLPGRGAHHLHAVPQLPRVGAREAQA